MHYPKFYHPIFPTLLLACAIVSAAPSAPANDALPVVPPRSINDITRMLAHYKPNEEVVEKFRQVADSPPPITEVRQELFDFYWKRGLAAAELGRLPQQIADLRLATENGRPATGEYARSLRNLATAEVQGGNLLNALNLVKEAIKQTPQTSTGQLTGAYGQVVSLASLVGDFELAERNLAQLESILAFLKSKPSWSLGSHFWLSAYERARGDLFRLSGKAIEAEGAYRKALRENELALADLPTVKKSWADTPTPENLRLVSELLERSIANTLLVQGKLVEAETMSRLALQHSLERAGRASPEVGRGLRLLSSVIAEQGRYAESAKLAEAALDSLRQSGAAPDSQTVLDAQRATIAGQVALGKYREALQTYDAMRQAVAAKPELAEKLLKGDLDIVLALLRTGNTGAAENMAARMLAASRQQLGEKSTRTAEVRAFHAMALADQGNIPHALDAFLAAVPLLVERARNDSESETGSIRKQQRLVIIIERYLRLLSELQQQKPPPSGVDPANESFMLADLARGSAVQRALTRSAARSAIKDPALADLARQEQDAQRRANSLNDLLSQLLSAPPDQQLPVIQAKLRADVDALKQTRDKLKKDIEKRFPEYAQLVDPPPVNLAQVQKMLHPGEVLLSWYFGEESAQVWAVTADGRTRFATLPGNRASMAAAVGKLRQALNPEVPTIEQIPAFDVSVAHQLFQQVIGPVADLTERATVLLAVPHAELGQLPLSLLVSAPTPQPATAGTPFTGYRKVPWLMRHVAIAQLPSVTALASLRRLPAGAADRLPFIGFGDPYFSQEQADQAEKKLAPGNLALRGVPLKLRNVPKTGGVDSAELALLPRLPDTAEEIREIAKALHAEPSRDIFLHRDASEKSVFATDLSNRRVVMFATHGLIPGELNGLTQPALALSAPDVAGGEGDGLLTQEKILSLKLNADWVVLSACNTAAGEGSGSEAVSGLGRAFFYAGARALLVSNWPVETEAARGLMTDLFKRQAASSELGKAEALRQAMQALVDGPGHVDAKTGRSLFSYAHPLFWAPFVLVGD